MMYVLTEDQSIQYFEGGWDRADVEERVSLELALVEVAEPVAVVLCDRSAVAFYLTSRGEVV
jgi:hypothetical protein